MRGLAQCQSSSLMPIISNNPFLDVSSVLRLLLWAIAQQAKHNPIPCIAFVTGCRRDGYGSFVQGNSRDGRPHWTYCDSTESLFERISILPDTGERLASMI
jgi:hypothetical protein